MNRPIQFDHLDHLVYGVPHLLAGVATFAAETGVDPVPGGRHAGHGTANYLVGLGASAYLEIIGPDPEEPGAPPQYLFGVDALAQPRLLTWCIRPDDLDRCVAAARSRGYDPGDAAELSRRSATGGLLRWRLTPDTMQSTGGTVPFLIDWGRTAHPTSQAMPNLELVAFTLHSASPDRTAQQLGALGIGIGVEYAEAAAVRAVLGTPTGRVALG